MWHIWTQPQQRGVQFRPLGTAPREAVKDRDAQEHDRAAEDADQLRGGQAAVRQPVYPAGRMVDEPKHDPQDDLPLPEGK